MNFFDYKAVKVWFDDMNIWVELLDGSKASLPIQQYPLLVKASKNDLEKVEIINGYALYWQTLGEDLSVAGFFENNTNTTSKHGAKEDINT